MPSASYGLRHPASASCLGRHARLAGRCPNNSSLFPPLAAVVVVAGHSQRKQYFRFRSSGTPAGVPLLLFHRRGRDGKRQVQRRFLRKRGAADIPGHCHTKQKSHRFCISASTMASYWSGQRGSNSLPPPWQGGALPDELRPHIRCIYPCTLPSDSCEFRGPRESLQSKILWGKGENPVFITEVLLARLPNE